MNNFLLVIFILVSKCIVAQHYCNAVIYSISPDCKLCQSKSFDINETVNLCSINNIKVYFVFHSGVNRNKAKKFVNLFYKKKTINVVFDKEDIILKKHNVNITPTVLLFDNDCSNIYFGAIDDKDFTIQKSKSAKTISYIDTAIKSYISNTKINISCTMPVGCVFR